MNEAVTTFALEHGAILTDCAVRSESRAHGSLGSRFRRAFEPCAVHVLRPLQLRRGAPPAGLRLSRWIRSSPTPWTGGRSAWSRRCCRGRAVLGPDGSGCIASRHGTRTCVEARGYGSDACPPLRKCSRSPRSRRDLGAPCRCHPGTRSSPLVWSRWIRSASMASHVSNREVPSPLQSCSRRRLTPRSTWQYRTSPTNSSVKMRKMMKTR
jgi:hypothetical protein